MDYKIRKATLDDPPALENLISLSTRGLGIGDYTPEQIEAAIGGVFGVDTDLICDGTYFVASANGEIVGCGGWSKRKTLFGGDRYKNRDAGELDPQLEPAKIRAFFIHPAWARKGIAKAILTVCEESALACGFSSLELMATLPGFKFYSACGYEARERVTYELNKNLTIEFIPMKKNLLAIEVIDN